MFRSEVVQHLKKIHSKGKASYSDVVKLGFVHKSDRGNIPFMEKSKYREKVPSIIKLHFPSSVYWDMLASV